MTVKFKKNTHMCIVSIYIYIILYSIICMYICIHICIYGPLCSGALGLRGPLALWGPFGVLLAPLWGPCGTLLGAFWSRFGADLESNWSPCEALLGPMGALGSLWDPIT